MTDARRMHALVPAGEILDSKRYVEVECDGPLVTFSFFDTFTGEKPFLQVVTSLNRAMAPIGGLPHRNQTENFEISIAPRGVHVDFHLQLADWPSSECWTVLRRDYTEAVTGLL